MGTFQRREKKFLLNSEQYRRFLEQASPYLEKAEYFESTMQSVYYDTPCDTLICRSIEKPLYKEKLRIRKYLGTEEDPLVYIELKKKFEGIGYKRRTLVDGRDLQKNGLQGCVYESPQIGSEIRRFIEVYPGLQPRMRIKTTRYSYVDRLDPEIRITFDQNVSYSCEELDIFDFRDGKALLPEGSVILEVKVPDTLPLRYTAILTNEKIYRRPFSKYGTAYLKERGMKGEYL